MLALVYVLIKAIAVSILGQNERKLFWTFSENLGYISRDDFKFQQKTPKKERKNLKVIKIDEMWFLDLIDISTDGNY